MEQLNILYLEDNKMDVELLKSILEKENIDFTIKVVVKQKEYTDSLLNSQFNIILIDYKLPELDGLTALQLAKEICPEIPVIVVSGTIGEEKAVETLKCGAVDYILKHNIFKLIPILEHALEISKLHRERKLAEMKLLHLNNILSVYLKINQYIVREKNIDLLIKKVCTTLTKINHYSKAWIIIQDGKRKHGKLVVTIKNKKKISTLQLTSNKNTMKCCKEAKKNKILILNESNDQLCKDCVLNSFNSTWERMICRLHYGNKHYGFMGIAMNLNNLLTKEESTLFQEIADNLSFALHSREIEKQRQDALEMIKENIHFLQVLIDVLPIPVYYKDIKGQYLGCNDAFADFFGIKKEEITGKTNFQVLPEKEATFIQKKDKELFKNKEIQNYEYQLSAIGGLKRNVIINKAVFQDKDGNIGGLIGAMADITEIKRKELALKNSENFNKQIIESSKDCIAVLDVEGNLLFMNSESYTQLKINNITPYLHKPWVDLWHGTIKQAITRAITKVKKGDVRIFQGASSQSKKSLKQWEVVLTPILSSNGSIEKILAVAHDITRRKSTEKNLRQSLKEKEILLKEIHHRVKNNLMVIISLMQLTSKDISDQKVVSLLLELQNRIHSLALIHNKLYQSINLNKISFSYYIKDIVKYLYSVYNVETNPIDIKFDIEDRYLDINHAIPCGLIVNELVTNSLNHAFPYPSLNNGEKYNNTKKQNEILIKFFKEKTISNKNRIFTILVSDNGKGIPGKINPMMTDSLGLRLVNILVKQLNGTININGTNGTTVTISFSEN